MSNLCPECRSVLVKGEVSLGQHVTMVQGVIPKEDFDKQSETGVLYEQRYKCANGHLYFRKSKVPIK